MVDIALNQKNLAAEHAVKELKDGMVLGVGSGTTVRLFIERLNEWLTSNEAEIICIPTSYATEFLLKSFDLPVSNLWEYSSINLTIDGADKIDPKGRMIKGLGGALFREKMIAYSSDEVIIMVDSSKWVNQLSPPWVLPVEVSRFAYRMVLNKLEKIGGSWRLRIDPRLGNPFITDDNNFILDGTFKEPLELSIEELNMTIKLIPGAIETGLFLGLCSKAIIGEKDQVREVHFKY